MLKKSWFPLVILSVFLSLLILGCSSIVNAQIFTSNFQTPVASLGLTTGTATPFQAVTNTAIFVPPSYTPTPTHTSTPTSTATSTNTPTPTYTSTSTNTPIPTDTPSVIWNPAGHVKAPILLYHHVSGTGYVNRYYVSIENFRAQMQALRDWGYTTITPNQLADVLINGGEIPNRPVIITFDDGNSDVYQNAFPIMRELGFVGAFYIVGDRLNSNNYVNADQLREMAADGWEIGSHSMTHVDATLDHSVVRYEVLQSKLSLQEATGENIDTFAYSYGQTDWFVSNKVSEYGYRAAMGLGMSWDHTLDTLFYLNRREVQGDYSLSNFALLLPWPER